MNFLFPGFLWAMFSLAIPVIIHLFNFRRYRKVYFTNVRFLKELKQESESKSKIKQYLILLSRLIALACLVFVFAQPYIPGTNSAGNGGQKAISIYLDNSFSMEAVSPGGYLIDVAKAKARELVKGFAATDKYQLLTNDFEGKHQRLVSRDEFLNLLDEVRLSPAHKHLHEIYSRQHDMLEHSGCTDKRLFLFSDFQRSFISEKKLTADTSMSCNLIPLLEKNTPGDNVYIDTCWFESPVRQMGSIQKLHVKIINKSSKDLDNAALRLFINGKLISPASFSAKYNEEKEVVITFTIKEHGIQQCHLEIDDHPVTYDDKLFFSFTVERKIPVLLINGEAGKAAQALRKLLQGDSLFLGVEMSENAIDYSSLYKNNLIILNDVRTISSGSQQELKKFIADGGSVAVFPAAGADLTSYNEFFSQIGVNLLGNVDTTDLFCDKINFEQGFFSDVFEKKSDNMDLPKIFNHFSVSRGANNSEEAILKLMNGMPFLSSYVFGKGKFYLCSSSLDERWSNLSRHALFVPAIYKMAINSQPVHPLYYVTGKNTAVEVKRMDAVKEQNYNVRSVDGKYSFIPEMRSGESKTLLFMQQMVQYSGNYFLTFEKENVSGLAFNYPREESVLEYFSVQELKDIFSAINAECFHVADPGAKNVQSVLDDLNGGSKLWKVFIILALVFFAVEIALNRLMK